jgi:hypothetical protein
MLYVEIITVCSEIHTEHINTVCGQNVEFSNVKAGGVYSNHWALQGQRVNIRCLAQNNESLHYVAMSTQFGGLKTDMLLHLSLGSTNISKNAAVGRNIPSTHSESYGFYS